MKSKCIVKKAFFKMLLENTVPLNIRLRNAA